MVHDAQELHEKRCLRRDTKSDQLSQMFQAASYMANVWQIPPGRDQ